MTPDDIIEHDEDVFVTRFTIKPNVSLDELAALLRSRRATGEIRVLFNQGGKQQILLTEHTKLTPSERDQVRKIMKME